jgi:hypothetical protein
MKCYLTVVSLLSPESRSYLYNNNIVLGSIFVLYNNRVWTVSRVNRVSNQTLLCNQDNGDTIWVDNAIVEENEIND